MTYDMRDFGYFGEDFKLRDVTDQWAYAIFEQKEAPSLIFLILGGRGSGKTAKAFLICELLWVKYKVKTAMLNLNKSPDLVAYLKEKGVEWIYNVDDEKDVLPHSILMIDEAVLSANAKEAHTPKAKLMEKWVSISRHKDCSLVVCSQRPHGAYKFLRDEADLTYYCNCPAGWEAEEIYPKVIYMYGVGRKIAKLGKDEAVVYSSLETLKLNKSLGLLKGLPLPKMWDDRVSKMWSGLNFNDGDIDYDFYASEAFKVGMQVKTVMERNALRAWLRNSYDGVEGFSSSDFTKIIDELSLMYVMQSKDKKVTQVMAVVGFAGLDFVDWVVKNYEQLNEPEKAKVFKLATSGVSEDGIAETMGTNQPRINQMINEMEENELGIFFERYWRNLKGDTRELPNYHNEPDCIGSDGTVWSCKTTMLGRKVKCSFNKKEFDPEIKYCMGHGIPQFKVVLFSGRWATKIHEQIIELANIKEKAVFQRC